MSVTATIHSCNKCNTELVDDQECPVCATESNQESVLSHDWDDDGIADWIWQFADSEQEAISNHADKVDEWASDVDKGIKPKATY